jgi:hypothetical protein
LHGFDFAAAWSTASLTDLTFSVRLVRSLRLSPPERIRDCLRVLDPLLLTGSEPYQKIVEVQKHEARLRPSIRGRHASASPACYRVAASRSTAKGGCRAGRASSCRCGCSRACSAGGSSKSSRPHTRPVASNSSAVMWRSPTRKPSRRIWRRYAKPSGWSMPRSRSADRKPCSPTCPVIPTASPFHG